MQFTGTHPYTPFLWLMTLPELRRKAIRENMGMVVEKCLHWGNDEIWRSRMKEKGGCNERRWKESGEAKECKKEFWLLVEWRNAECEYLPGYWLLSRSWPPLTVNPNPDKLPVGVQAALSSWLSTKPCVDTSLLPLKINTLPPRSSPPNGQPTATSMGGHACMF